MKKEFVRWMLLCTLVLLPNAAFAQVQYLKVTVVSANIWPSKPTGKCWDPCLGKRYKLPPRGNADFSKNFQDKEFAEACAGTKAPDPFVELKIGKYGIFSTAHVNDSCTPKWGVSHTFRVEPSDSFTVTVYDHDGAAGIQAKRDLVGVHTSATVPEELMKGGRLVLKGFGQVEELVLQGEIVKEQVSAGCEGVYEVRIVEYDVQPKKATGKSWDPGLGKMTLPDVVVNLDIGGTKLATPKKQDTTSAVFRNVQGVFTIKQGMSLSLGVYDLDLRSQETIGQTAETDVCKIINAQGEYTFSNFGQVKKVVIQFVKKK